MYGIFDTRKWCGLAVIILFAFLAVLAAHPFITHDHDHALFDSGPLPMVHTGLAERGDILPTIPPAAIVTLSLALFVSPIAYALRRGLQHVDIPTLLALRAAYGGGILNTKAF